MTKKLYPGQQPDDWTAADGSRPKKVPKPLIFIGAGIWVLMVLVAVLANERHVNSSSSVPSAAPAVTKASPDVATKAISDQPDFLHELPLIKPDAVATKDRKALSGDAQELRELWAEMEAFRFDPKFHVLGFDPPWVYAEWAGKVQTLDARAGRKITEETGILPRELITIASEYQRSRGLQTERSQWGEERLIGALNPAARGKGQGRAQRDTQGCRDFDMWARSARALDEGNFETSNELLDKADCIPIAGGTVVSAPSRRRSFDWIKSRGSSVSLLVRVNGEELWIAEDELSY